MLLECRELSEDRLQDALMGERKFNLACYVKTIGVQSNSFGSLFHSLHCSPTNHISGMSVAHLSVEGSSRKQAMPHLHGGHY